MKYDSFRQAVVATCGPKTVIITNPGMLPGTCILGVICSGSATEHFTLMLQCKAMLHCLTWVFGEGCLLPVTEITFNLGQTTDPVFC